MRVCLFEDQADSFDPLTLTRPVFELLCGVTSLRQKQLRALGAGACGLLVRPHLEELTRCLLPSLPVNDQAWLSADMLVLVNGRWLPPHHQVILPAGPCVGLAGGEVVYAVLGPAQTRHLSLSNLPELLARWQTILPVHLCPGTLLRHPWDLVAHNSGALCRDFEVRTQQERRPPQPPGLALVGPADNLWIDPSARIDPYVVADASNGPVMIAAGAVVTAFTRLEGPCAIGPSSQVHGAKVRAGTTLGPHCRVGGEVEASILHGHSNKYHDGFLGHSYVGEWVNLGAGTSNSDLRNDYGEVTVSVQGRTVATGQTKVGCFLGDHTKTGLGTLLNTGTSVGAFCNLLPAGRFAPKYVPSFCNWWNGSLREGFDIDQLLATAALVMKRRGQTLTPAHAALYRALQASTGAERRRALRESEQRALRRSA